MAEKESGSFEPAQSNFVEKIIDKITQMLNIFASVFLVFLVCLIFISVVARYIFNAPIQGSDEYSIYLFILVAFLGVGLCSAQNQHLRVEIIVDHLPKKGQIFFDITNHIMTILVSVFIVWMSIIHSMDAHHMGLASSITNIPKWPFILIVAFGYSIMIIVHTAMLLKIIIWGAKK